MKSSGDIILMLNTLKIIQGAVSKKDFIPVMKAVHFYGDRVQSTNGHLTIDAPSPQKLNVTVDAKKLIKAVTVCENSEMGLKVTDKSLIIKSGSFKAQLPRMVDEHFPKTNIEKEGFVPCPDILDALCRIRPFIGQDASKIWACGALLQGTYITATNNTTIVRTKISQPFTSTVNLPYTTIDELIRLKLKPQSINLTDSAIVFQFENDIWLRSSLYTEPWPDVSSFFESQATTPINSELLSSVEKILPFCSNANLPIIKFEGDTLRTEDGEMLASINNITEQFVETNYDARVLIPVLERATHINFNNPKSIFKGNDLEGVFMAIRL